MKITITIEGGMFDLFKLWTIIKTTKGIPTDKDIPPGVKLDVKVES